MRPGSVRSILRGPPMTLCDVIRGGYFTHVTTLIQMGLNVNGRDPEGKTPIMLCALIEDEDWGVGIARSLIENGARLNMVDKFGLSALHLAVIYERVNLIKVFLKAIDFDPNLVDRLGNTALHYAAVSGNKEVTELLVQYWNKYGLNGCLRNKRRKTALEEAYRAHSYDCVSVLINLNSTHYCVCSPEWEKIPPVTTTGRRPSTVSSVSTMLSTHISDISVFSSRSLKQHSSCKTLERPRSSPQPNERDSQRVIHSADRTDFRNKREYIFKLTAIPYDKQDLCDSPAQSAKSQSCRCLLSASCPQTLTWRTELKRLLHEYEFQCSPSYREPARTATDETVTTEDDDDEENKDKKKLCRRTSLMSRTSIVSETREKRKLNVNQKQRKVSVLPVHARSPDSLDMSWKKKEMGLHKDFSKAQIHSQDPNDTVFSHATEEKRHEGIAVGNGTESSSKRQINHSDN